MEKKINEVFEFNGVKLKCVEREFGKCEDCYFYIETSIVGCHSNICHSSWATDNKDRKFIKIEENENEN